MTASKEFYQSTPRGIETPGGSSIGYPTSQVDIDEIGSPAKGKEPPNGKEEA